MIGRILKNIRKIRGLTQEKLGKELNIANNTISNYENEECNPAFSTIKRITDVCDFEIQFVDKQNNKVYTIEELSKEMDF